MTDFGRRTFLQALALASAGLLTPGEKPLRPVAAHPEAPPVVYRMIRIKEADLLPGDQNRGNFIDVTWTVVSTDDDMITVRHERTGEHTTFKAAPDNIRTFYRNVA